MQKWEYVTLNRHWNRKKTNYFWDVEDTDNTSMQDKLNIVGKEGWELVAVQSLILEGTQAGMTFFLKRPL